MFLEQTSIKCNGRVNEVFWGVLNSSFCAYCKYTGYIKGLPLYSFFENGCRTNRYATMWKGTMGNGGSWFLDWGFRCFSDIERKSPNKCSYAFSFLVPKHWEPQSNNAKLFLLIIPMDIAEYAFTLLWDNLFRNSCIFKNWFMPSLRISSYGGTREVWRAQNKRKSSSRR